MKSQISATILTLLIWAAPAPAQNPPPSTMIIDVDNGLFYARDVTDFSRLATVLSPTPVAATRNFSFAEGLGDIVAINGKPMSGTWHSRSFQVGTNPNPQPGQAIADVAVTGTLEWIMDIRTPEGQPVGLITGYGWNGGGGPIGMSGVDTVNMVITGGTGAFVGIRGQMGASNQRMVGALPYRGNASISEDPARRRMNGPGQTRRHVLQVFPMLYPEIVTTADGLAAAWHQDFSPVTAARPARAGELLLLAVSNLGAVRPNIEFGQRFPADPLAIVNSPIEVVVGGRDAEVIHQFGWPGLANRFRVDFRVPDGVQPGMASLHLRAAFINGVAVRIPVQ